MVTKTINLIGAVRKHLEQASPDLLREMAVTFAELLMSTDADAPRTAPTSATVFGERLGEVFCPRQ